jgi:zinc protease
LLIAASVGVYAQPVQRTLPNGLRLVVDRYAAAPLAAVRIYVNTGSVHEGRWTGAGISHLLEHVACHGGVKYQDDEVWKASREMGEGFGAYTSKSVTCYYVTTTADKVDLALDLLKDVVFYTAIAPEAVKQEQEVIVRENSKDENEPYRVLYDLFASTLFPTHPEHVPIGGDSTAMAACSAEDVRAYHRERYQPDNIVVSLVGNFDPNAMMRKAAEALSTVPRGYAVPAPLPVEPRPGSVRVQVRYKEDVQRAHLMLGWRSVASDSPDMYPLDVLAVMLGEGETSLLVGRLQNQQGLVDHIGCGNYTPTYDAGAFQIMATCDPAKIQQVREAILVEVARVGERGASPEQVRKAQKQVVAGKVFSDQTPEQRADSLGYGWLLYGDPSFSARYVEHIQQVTPEQVTSAARRYLHPGTYALAVLAPPGTPVIPVERFSTGTVSRPSLFTLPNGLRVVFMPEPGSGSVQFTAVTLAGQSHEPERKAGVSPLTAQILTRGAGGRSQQDLATPLEACGAILSAGSGLNTVYFQGQALAEDADLLVRTAALEITRPDFPPAELEHLQRQTLAAIAAQQESPHLATRLLLDPLLFADSPYAFARTGTAETIQALSREDLLSFYRAAFHPHAIVLGLSGDLTLAQARSLVEKHFGPWKAPRGSLPALRPARPVTQRQVKTVSRPQNEAAVYYGWAGATITGADRFAWELLQNVLGATGTEDSLFLSLRNAGLVYDAGAYAEYGLLPAAFVVYAITEPGKVEVVQQRIEQVIRRLQDTPLTAEALAEAKNVVRSRHLAGQADPKDRLLTRALDETYGLGYDFMEKVSEKIDAVTAAQLRELALKHLDLERATVVITRPAEIPTP